MPAAAAAARSAPLRLRRDRGRCPPPLRRRPCPPPTPDRHRLPFFPCSTTATTHFQSLARSILYHNLPFPASTASYSRLLSLLGGPDCFLPGAVLALTPDQLRRSGVSGQKAAGLRSSGKGLSPTIRSPPWTTLPSSACSPPPSRGVGVWSAHMFMIFALHRPDVLPTSDLGLLKGVQLLHGLEELPEPSEVERLCERWRPYWTVGAWYIWRLAEAKEAASP